MHKKINVKQDIDTSTTWLMLPWHHQPLSHHSWQSHRLGNSIQNGFMTGGHMLVCPSRARPWLMNQSRRHGYHGVVDSSSDAGATLLLRLTDLICNPSSPSSWRCRLTAVAAPAAASWRVCGCVSVKWICYVRRRVGGLCGCGWVDDACTCSWILSHGGKLKIWKRLGMRGSWGMGKQC